MSASVPDSPPDPSARREWMLILALAALTLLGAGVRRVRDRAAPVPSVVQAAAHFPFRVDVNSATADELRVLPGIGETRANAAVAAREQEGRFDSLESFAAAAGLPPSALERIRWLVALGGPEGDGAPPPDRRAPERPEGAENQEPAP